MNEISPRLRIGVDGYNMAMTRGTGVATYARTLTEAIRGAGHALDLVYGLPVPPKTDAAMRETLFFARLGEGVGDGASAPKPTLRRTVRRALTSPLTRDLIEVPVTGRVIANDFAGRMPAFDRLFTLGSIFEVSARYFRRFGRFMPVRIPSPPDVMHWTYPLPIRMIGTRNVYTIHDLVPLRLPHTSLEDKAYYNRLIARCVADADRIVTVSDASRTDILNLFPVDPARVVNSYQPADVPPARLDDAALDLRLSRLFDLKRDGYFLFFGAIEPKKNVGRLIEAYLGADLDTPLVIVGGRGWRWEQELRLLGDGAHGRRLSAATSIRELEYLPRSLLLELVQGARGVLFPSLYEGFGLPALEAMTMGVPVITSNTSALPEVVGDAAIMVDPYDVPALTAALRTLDADPALRLQMRRAGPEQAKTFSMARYQMTMDRLYHDIAGGAAGIENRPPARSVTASEQ